MICCKWADWKAKRLEESRGQQPNYTFDAFLKKSQELGDEISSFVGDAKQKDAELDKEKKKSPPPEKEKEKDDDDTKDEKRKAWETLKNVAKERAQEAAKKSVGSSAKSTKPPRSTSK